MSTKEPSPPACQLHKPHFTPEQLNEIATALLTLKPPQLLPWPPLRLQQAKGSTNCFQVCVAALLHLDVEQVPKSCDAATWDFGAANRWLYDQMKLQMLEILLIDDEGKYRERLYPAATHVPCIVVGRSPRHKDDLTEMHAVIALMMADRSGFELIHDPHPDQTFVDNITHAIFFVRC